MRDLGPTFNLLSASVLLAISGGFKLYIAFILIGVQPDLRLCLASSLIIYATYTLDRTLGCEEDKINCRGFGHASKGPALLATASATVISVSLLFQRISPFITFFPFVIGYLYNKGISMGNLRIRLKGRLGIKNLVVAFVWAISIVAFLCPNASDLLPLLMIFTFFFTKSFINTLIYDFRDIKGDSEAGIITLPVHWGPRNTYRNLVILHLLLHIIAITIAFLGLLSFEVAIFLYSGIAGYLGIYLYCSENPKKVQFRDILVDGEWIVSFFLRTAICGVFP